jgi:hypothetical protein
MKTELTVVPSVLVYHEHASAGEMVCLTNLGMYIRRANRKTLCYCGPSVHVHATALSATFMWLIKRIAIERARCQPGSLDGVE